MALEGYKSNNNVVYSSKYHCVWTPKYRRATVARIFGSLSAGPFFERIWRICEEDTRPNSSAYEHQCGGVLDLLESGFALGIHNPEPEVI
jgi:hypothetical protein